MLELVMTPDKHCKHSVRYASNPTIPITTDAGTTDIKSPLPTVYLHRNFAPEMPPAIRVTIQSASEVDTVPPPSKE